MTIDDKIGEETLQYDFIREAEKISALSCRNILWKYLTGDDII